MLWILVQFHTPVAFTIDSINELLSANKEMAIETGHSIAAKWLNSISCQMKNNNNSKCVYYKEWLGEEGVERKRTTKLDDDEHKQVASDCSLKCVLIVFHKTRGYTGIIEL